MAADGPVADDHDLAVAAATDFAKQHPLTPVGAREVVVAHSQGYVPGHATHGRQQR
jgi:hypothetical protein